MIVKDWILLGCLFVAIAFTIIDKVDNSINDKLLECYKLGYAEYKDGYCTKTLANETRVSQKLTYLRRQ